MNQLDKQLRMIQLTEDITLSFNKLNRIDFDAIEKGLEAKNPVKVLRSLKQVPNLTIPEIYDLSSKKVKNFDAYYNHAMVSWKGEDVEVKKALASLYAIIKSAERQIPFGLRKTVVIFSKKLWVYSEGAAVRGLTLKFILWLVSLTLTQGTLISLLVTGGMTFAGYLFYVALALSILKWLIGRVPRR